MSDYYATFFALVDAGKYADALMTPGIGHHVIGPRKSGDPHICTLLTERGKYRGEGKDAMQALRNAAVRLKHTLRTPTRPEGQERDQ